MKAVEWDAKEHFRQAMIRRNDLDSDGTITIGAKTGWNRERTLTAMAAWDRPASTNSEANNWLFPRGSLFFPQP